MWVDAIADEVLSSRPLEKYLINDAKSPSGPIHIGSLRGVILHDAVARGLGERINTRVKFKYGFDDYDPLDAVPSSLPKHFKKFLGRPLSAIPSPKGAESYARHYAESFMRIWSEMGVNAEVYWTSEMYARGDFDEAIAKALDEAHKIIAIDREISGSRKQERHPVQPLCERCQRIGTTVVLGWDGKEVEYECREDKVRWAKGCGYRGKRSPFRGGSKLQYIVEWAAKWSILGVAVEGAGKDHMTRGGSHERASVIAKRIFQCPVPFPIAYEWFLVGGRKMSSSKAVGMSATDLLRVLRPELARFLIIRPHYKEQINFDPGGETIPRLYDEYDRAIDAYAKVGWNDDSQSKTLSSKEGELRDLARTLHYARIDGIPEQMFRLDFLRVAYAIQMPHVRLTALAREERGTKLTTAEKLELRKRRRDATRWLKKYAPEQHKFRVLQELPKEIPLAQHQRAFLSDLWRRLHELYFDYHLNLDVGSKMLNAPRLGEYIQQQIHEARAPLGISSSEAFQAIYTAFLGKEFGPRAGSLLAALKPRFVLERLHDASAVEPHTSRKT